MENGLTPTTFRMVKNGLTESQQADLLAWVHELHALGRSPRTLERYIARLVPFARKYPVSFSELTKDQIVEHMGTIVNEVSRRDFGVVLKGFLRWKHGGSLPACISWWKPCRLRSNLLPENILTEQEVLGILNHIPSARDRCFVHLLYDTGARVGELLSLQRQHVNFDDLGAVIIVGGKSGRRRLRSISAAPALRDYMNVLDDKRPDAPLWLTYARKPVGYQTILHTILKASSKAGITKKVGCHSFRHARATALRRNGVSESSLRAQFGWTDDSAMVERYSHLTAVDVDNELAKATGMPVPTKTEKSCLTPISCPVCKQDNDATYSFCARCGSSLLPGLEGDLEKFTEQVSRLMNDPQIVEMAEKWHEADAKGIYGPHIEREAQLLRFVASIGERQIMILRALGGLKQEPMFQPKSDEEVVQWARAELEQDMKKVRKPRAKA